MRLPGCTELKTLIGAPCLVRKDRAGRVLFVSDFPRRLKAAEAKAAEVRLRQAGYVPVDLGGLCLIDWTEEAYRSYFEALPALPLQAGSGRARDICRLLAEHPAALAAQDIAVLAQALRYLEIRAEDKALRLIEGALADSLRERRAPPFHAARLFIARGLS